MRLMSDASMPLYLAEGGTAHAMLSAQIRNCRASLSLFQDGDDLVVLEF